MEVGDGEVWVDSEAGDGAVSVAMVDGDGEVSVGLDVVMVLDHWAGDVAGLTLMGGDLVVVLDAVSDGAELDVAMAMERVGAEVHEKKP